MAIDFDALDFVRTQNKAKKHERKMSERQKNMSCLQTQEINLINLLTLITKQLIKVSRKYIKKSGLNW